MRRSHAIGRRSSSLAACAALVALAGCGSSGHYKNDPRPPVTLQITGAILPDKVAISPAHFGAGPISLTIANETGASQRVSIVRQINGQQQANEQTGPINPHDTATLSADVDPGSYTVRVEGASIKPAPLAVGAKRKSAQNELLQP